MPSKQKPTWRSGLHDVYIARDNKEGWFKIGLTGKDLEYYRKRLCHRIYGRRSYDSIEMCCSWLFEDFWAAWYIEQTTIALIERLGFERVREGDWFSIDRRTLAVVVEVIDDVAFSIRKWEQENFCFHDGLQCLPSWLGPWERALTRAGRKFDVSKRLYPAFFEVS
jgi:hypothetical protein